MTVPKTGMIFAAGFGTRMEHLTKNCPKPLLKVDGRPLIDYALDLLADAGIARNLVNAHYLADMIIAHLQDRANTRVFNEQPHILETGGGLKNVLTEFSGKSIITLNSDMIWTGNNPISALKSAWNPENMDALLMLLPKENARGHTGLGDFFLDSTGRLTRRGSAGTAPFVFSGAQIIKTEPVRQVEQEAFSLNVIWDDILKKRRVFGIVHDGGWVDVGRPEGIEMAQDLLSGTKNV